VVGVAEKGGVWAEGGGEAETGDERRREEWVWERTGQRGPWTGGSSAMQELNGTNGFEGSERQQEEQEGRLRGVRCVEQGRICSQSPRAGDMSRAHNVGITFKLHRRPSPTVEAAVDAACLL
jgi:hypothetical protein